VLVLLLPRTVCRCSPPPQASLLAQQLDSCTYHIKHDSGCSLPAALAIPAFFAGEAALEALAAAAHARPAAMLPAIELLLLPRFGRCSLSHVASLQCVGCSLSRCCFDGVYQAPRFAQQLQQLLGSHAGFGCL